jgi:hypothetical protein
MTSGDTTGETVECFNCGRANPPWAQVCRFCGVPLVAAGSPALIPSGPFPTDSRSLLSMGAAKLADLFLNGVAQSIFQTG